MSERTFFSLRHTVPGYTFIFWIFLVNLESITFFFLYHRPTIDLSSNIITLFGIVLGFLTLLSGAAIGFLVSQFWYLIYWKVFSGRMANLYAGELIDNYEALDKEASILIFNYLVHSYKPKGIFTYIDRRWELLTIFGSTSIAVILGSIIGWIMREFVLCIPHISTSHINWLFVDIAIWVVSAVLIALFVAVFYFVSKSAYEMGVFAVRMKAKELAQDGRKLRDEFPEEYFKSQK